MPPMTLDELGRVLGQRLVAREEVPDEDFDVLLSERPKAKSGQYWSCVEAGQTAAKLFEKAGAKQVLDVGAGVGKFCSIASLTTSRRVFGLERRGALVQDARQLARRLSADVMITEGVLSDVVASQFDGFYFFNPFAEYVSNDAGRYDAEFPRSFDQYIADARVVEKWLLDSPLGTAMVTYNGLGGRIPVCFVVQHTTRVRDDVMRLWVKTGPVVSTEAWVEVEDELVKASRLAMIARDGGQAFADSPLVRMLSSPLPSRGEG
jgi:SAM-dependent methyltransferase